jgi:hypothetical protein
VKRSWLIAGCGVLALLGPLAPSAAHANPPAKNVSTIAVYGDAPYGTTPTDTAEFKATPSFIDSVNADPNVGLVLHVGDIHSGKQYCTQAYDQSIFDVWKNYQDPVVYTPGDNEWTDCNKKGEGGGAYNATTQQIDYVLDANNQPVDYAKGDPIANLDLVRSIFFAHPGRTLGQNSRSVLSQSFVYDPNHAADRKYVENVMWTQSDVVFVTINLPGGSNNDTDVWYAAPAETAAQTQERTERTAADIRWLNLAFAIANGIHAKGVVIGAQADVWDPEKGAAHQTAYEPIVKTVADDTTAFGRPVLMFNGDSHVYRSDNPLSPTASCVWELADPCTSVASLHPGYDVPNFHRLVVHGSTFPLEWLKLTIDPSQHAANGDSAFGPFSWARQTQPLPQP